MGFAVLSFALPKNRLLVALAGLGIAASALIGGYHAGIEYGWWEGITACTSTAKTGGGDVLKAIMDAPLIRCDVAQWKLWGISLAGYNFLISGRAAQTVFQRLLKAKAA